jgi:protein-S-isoprenylcysteine O-methyltransferase Ste14
MTETDDKPGVIVWPPLVALATVALGLVLDWAAPLYLLRILLSFPTRVGVGLLLVAGGVALAIAGARTFRTSGTNVNPSQPALQLVTTGIYTHLRNPMYVGLALMVAGIGIGSGSDWMLILLIPAALVMHYGVVRREEAYLTRKFGDPYRTYMETVPRYGWPV